MKHLTCGPEVAISTPREILKRMQSHVKVKILREMHLNDRGIEREPVGWFRFDEAYQYNTLPEIFVRFVQQHLSRKECCKNSSSQIVIIFKDEEKEHEEN